MSEDSQSTLMMVSNRQLTCARADQPCHIWDLRSDRPVQGQVKIEPAAPLVRDEEATVPATCPSGGTTADSHGLSRSTCQQACRSADPQVAAMQHHRVPKLTVQALVRSGFRSWYAGGSVGVLPRTRRRRICDSRNLSRPSVAAGQPHRKSCVVHVHAKTALTEPVRHQVRQLSGSGEGSGQGRARSPCR